ncbi:MAG: polysaccharide deacetylase family protein [Gammaproteobacteria bacterium]|nr:polysaccharide deacetylase family protein [Gammaproteobacteria bacterium]
MERLSFTNTLALRGFRKALDLALRDPGRRRLSVLVYHRVLNAPDSIYAGDVDAATFRWQMGLVKEYLNPLPLPEAVERLAQGTLPPRAVSITFDDGYADNHALALPILQDLGLHATFFIATDFLNGGIMFNDAIAESVWAMAGERLDLRALGLGEYPLDTEKARQETACIIIKQLKHLDRAERDRQVEAIVTRSRARPPSLMMTDAQVRALAAAGMEVACHTKSHPILKKLQLSEAEAEIAGAREVLEGVIGEKVRLFAYPNGIPGYDYEQVHVDLIRRLGFMAAASTRWGVADRNTDRFQLPRFTPWDRTPTRFMYHMVQNYFRLVE